MLLSIMTMPVRKTGIVMIEVNIRLLGGTLLMTFLQNRRSLLISALVIVAAIIDRPSTVYGGVAAAPLFQQVARFAIQRLGIPSADPVSLPPHVLHLP